MLVQKQNKRKTYVKVIDTLTKNEYNMSVKEAYQFIGCDKSVIYDRINNSKENVLIYNRYYVNKV